MTNQHLTVTSKHENVTLLPSFLLKGAGSIQVVVEASSLMNALFPRILKTITSIL